MGKASRKKHAEEQKRLYFEIHGDSRAPAERTKAQAMLEALQKKLEDDALREDGFYFIDGTFNSARRPRISPGMKAQSYKGHKRRLTDTVVIPAIPTETITIYHVVTFGLDSICVWDMSTGENLASLDVLPTLQPSIHVYELLSITGTAGKHETSMSSFHIAYATHQYPILITYDTTARRMQHHNTNDTSNQSVTQPCGFNSFGHQQQIVVMSFSHSGKLLATGSLDSTCILWSVMEDSCNHRITLEMLQIFPVANMGVTGCVFTENDCELITCGDECIIKVWHLDTHESNSLSQQLQMWEQAMPFALTTEFSMDRLRLDDTLSLFHSRDEWLYYNHRSNVGKLQHLQLPLAHVMSSRTDSSSPHDNNSQDSVEILRRDCETFDHFDMERLLSPAAPLMELEGSSTTITWPFLVPSTLDSRCIREFRRQTLDGGFASHTSRISDCAVVSVLDMLVTVALDGSIIIWSISTGTIALIVRNAHLSAITSCDITPPTSFATLEPLLGTAGKDNCIKIWRLPPTTCSMSKNMECIYTLVGHFDAITSLHFDPSGVFLISASDDTLAHCWRVRPAVPEPPDQPLVTMVDRFSITIEWNEPLANGSALLEYIVDIIQRSSFYGEEDYVLIPPIRVASKYKTIKVENLQAGIQYTLRVAAINGAGQSEWSQETRLIETDAFIPSLIARPITYSEVGTTSIRLGWKSPCANGAPIHHYILRCLPEDTFMVPTLECRISLDDLKVIMIEDTSSTKRGKIRKEKALQSKVISPPTGCHRIDTLYEFTVNGLCAGEVYQFIVAGENRCGIGPFSPLSDYIKMESTAPDAPLQPIITKIEQRTAVVTWNKPRCNGSEILQYTIEWTQAKTFEEVPKSVVLLTKSIIGTHYTITGLQPGRSLQARVAAINLVHNRLTSSLFSIPSDLVMTQCEVPDKPIQPLIQQTTACTVTLEIYCPCDNGLPITHYQILFYSETIQFGTVVKHLIRTLDLTSSEFCNDKEGCLHYTIKELQAKTFYSFSVAAVNALGTSKMSDSSIAVSTKPPTVPATILDAPIITCVEPTSARITWTTPENDGGSNLVSYVLQYGTHMKTETDIEFKHEIYLFQANELVLENLKPKTTYQFRVLTTNHIGRALPSPPCEPFTTPSLVEFTVTKYFASRPPIEHEKATILQRQYRRWKLRIEQKHAFLQQLSQILASSWHLL